MELVTRSRGGDAAGFGELVRRYEGLARAAVLERMGPRAVVDDIVQDGFVRAYCKLGQLQDLSRFAGWLRMLMVREALGWVRSRRHRPEVSCADPGPDAQARPDGDAETRRRTVRQAVETLPERYRQVVALHYFEGWSYERIARFLRRPQSTIKGRLQQGRERLKTLIKPEDERTTAMNMSHVEEKVARTLYQVATAPIEATIPMQPEESLVVFCGLGGEVELCGTGGDSVVINGTRSTLGRDPEEASAALSGISAWADHVDEYMAAGPHDVELFMGTMTQEDQSLRAARLAAPDRWRRRRGGLAKGVWTSPDYESFFPDVRSCHPGLGEIVRRGLGRAVRVTLGSNQVQELLAASESLTDEAKRVFSINYDDGKRRHGSVGRVHVTIGVPVGRRVTVFAGGWTTTVRAESLRGDLTVVDAGTVCLKDIEGDVCLIDAMGREIHDVRGRLIIGFYGLGGGDPRDGRYGRAFLPEGFMDSVISRVRGEVWLDTARMDLEARDLSGAVRIRNCFGKTQFHKTAHDPHDRAVIETDSGAIDVFLATDLVKTVDVTAISLSGTLDYAMTKELNRAAQAWNDAEVMYVSTLLSPGDESQGPAGLGAPVVLRSKTGPIRV